MLARLCFALTLVVMSALDVNAQTCSADSQCSGAGMTTTSCAGNAVVTSRSVCAGSCQRVEVARAPCAGACSGGTCIDLGVRPAAPKNERALTACSVDCACRDGRLTVSTGLRDADGTCTVRVRRCKGGCACEPSPRCSP